MASDSGPAVQAGYMKNLFSGLDDRGLAERIARRDPELGAEVEAAGRLSWLPIELNLRTVDALCELLGETQGLDVLADCVFEQFETPLWKNFVAGGLRLLGREPGNLGRWLPRAFSLVFRDIGEWSVQRSGERELTVFLRAIPDPLLRQRRWVRSLGRGMRTLFLLCGTDGSADLVELDPDRREARYRLSW